MWQAHVIKLSQEMQPRVAIHTYYKVIQGCSDTVQSLSRSSSPPLDKPPYYEVKQLFSLSEAVRLPQPAPVLEGCSNLACVARKQWKGEKELGTLEEEDDVDCSFMQDISQTGKKVRHEMVRKCFMTYHLVLIGFVIFYCVCVFV